MKTVMTMLAVAMLAGAGFGASNEELADMVAADLDHVIRADVPWHERAKWFMYPPEESLRAQWPKMKTGWFTFTDRTGKERKAWKAEPYRPGTYKPAARSYRAAIELGYRYVFGLPALSWFAETGKPDEQYPLNCYPTKMHAATVYAMIDYAKRSPQDAERAMKLALSAGEYLLSTAFREGPLAGFTPTYEGDKIAAGKYSGQVMMSYPAAAGGAFLALNNATGDGKWKDAAVRIAERYLSLQGEDGTWYLKLWVKDGTPVNPNRLVPIGMLGFLESMYAATGDIRYRAAADRAFTYVEKGPLANWNWEGQFEDVEPMEKYKNLTKHDACSLAIMMLNRFPGDARRLAQARELLRFAEDQFVCWVRPFEGEDIKQTCWMDSYRDWHAPAVLEQYECYVPIDASAAKLMRTYIALYKAEGNPLDLAKARTLADAMTREQEAHTGRIPTWWMMHRSVKTGETFVPEPVEDWLNCMFSSLAALGEVDDQLPATVETAVEIDPSRSVGKAELTDNLTALKDDPSWETTKNIFARRGTAIAIDAPEGASRMIKAASGDGRIAVVITHRSWARPETVRISVRGMANPRAIARITSRGSSFEDAHPICANDEVAIHLEGESFALVEFPEALHYSNGNRSFTTSYEMDDGVKLAVRGSTSPFIYRNTTALWFVNDLYEALTWQDCGDASRVVIALRKGTAKHDREDGLKCIQWIRTLPNFNGKIVVAGNGDSGEAILQWLGEAPWDVKVATLEKTETDFYKHYFHNGLRVRPCGARFEGDLEAMQHPDPKDEWWSTVTAGVRSRTAINKTSAAVLLLGGWNQEANLSQFDTFSNLGWSPREKVSSVVGAYGEAEPGSASGPWVRQWVALSSSNRDAARQVLARSDTKFYDRATRSWGSFGCFFNATNRVETYELGEGGQFVSEPFKEKARLKSRIEATLKMKSEAADAGFKIRVTVLSANGKKQLLVKDSYSLSGALAAAGEPKYEPGEEVTVKVTCPPAIRTILPGDRIAVKFVSPNPKTFDLEGVPMPTILGGSLLVHYEN